VFKTKSEYDKYLKSDEWKRRLGTKSRNVGKKSVRSAGSQAPMCTIDDTVLLVGRRILR
jgi:hypothetical protein